MLAGHLPRFLAEAELLLTDRALRAVGQVGLRYGDSRHCLDSRSRRGRWPRAVVLGELIDQLVQIRTGVVVSRAHRRRNRRLFSARRSGGQGTPRARVDGAVIRGPPEDDPRTGRVAAAVVGVQLPDAVELGVAAPCGRGEERVVAEGADGGELDNEAGAGQVDLVQEAAVAAGAEDVGGWGADDADGAVTLVAPEEAAGPGSRGAQRHGVAAVLFASYLAKEKAVCGRKGGDGGWIYIWS